MEILNEVESKDDFPQTEVVKLLKISGAKIKTLRDNHMTTADWYQVASKGRPRVMYRPSGVAKLQIHLAAAEILPLAVPRFQEAVCLPMPINERSKHIWARVRQTSGEWERHPVLVTPRIRAHLFPGKPFKVQIVETEDGEKSYRHESLCP
tara:strand:+ start:25 stop:477 length:453 start_codon:yes stop_codon:yes gene_type:complete